MKRYGSIQNHGVQIGIGGKVNKKTKKIIKWTYLCWHIKKAKSNQIALIKK